MMLCLFTYLGKGEKSKGWRDRDSSFARWCLGLGKKAKTMHIGVYFSSGL